MKYCSACDTEKSFAFFYKDKKKKDGLTYICKPCSIAATYAWRDKNKEKRNSYARTYDQRPSVKEKVRAMRTKEKIHAAHQKRSSAIRLATPAWLTPEQRQEMREMKRLRRELQWLSEERLSVDHVVPLQGKVVCGLHVPWNLQIIPLNQNIRKLNKIILKHNHGEAIAPAGTNGEKALAEHPI